MKKKSKKSIFTRIKEYIMPKGNPMGYYKTPKSKKAKAKTKKPNGKTKVKKAK